MEIRKVTLAYFSPTGTTRKVLESIARGMALGNVDVINLTTPSAREGTLSEAGPSSGPILAPRSADELVFLGAPVYGGRIPTDAVDRLKRLRGQSTLAVLIVVYGNREFDDALLELRDLAVEQGFVPVAAGAFIGEHSFSTEAMPIANGRPDGLDVQKAMAFGAKLRDQITWLASPEAVQELDVPGRFPYEGGALSMNIAPDTDDDACTACGTCVDVCPTAAIVLNGTVVTDPGLCIRCTACIKDCPEDARSWQNPMMTKITTWLYEECQVRKEPEFFLSHGPRTGAVR